MDSVLGGGVLLAVAAALWLAYLVPNWLRRSEYLATERNAVRLQQTLRVLAETAETPEAIRLENAAKARAMEAALRSQQQRPVAVGTAALLPDPTDPKVVAAARLRRTRIVTTAAIAIAAVVLLSQLVTALIGGIAAASGLVATVSAGFLAAGLWLQGRLAKAQRAARRSAAATTPRVASGRGTAHPLSYPEVEVDERAWTPRPLPQPLHQVRREAAIRAAVEAERQIAARESEERRVAAASVPERARRVAPVPERAQRAAPVPERAQRAAPVPERAQRDEGPSRFAAMGVVGDLGASMPDIDGALARRRAS